MGDEKGQHQAEPEAPAFDACAEDEYVQPGGAGNGAPGEPPVGAPGPGGSECAAHPYARPEDRQPEPVSGRVRHGILPVPPGCNPAALDAARGRTRG